MIQNTINLSALTLVIFTIFFILIVPVKSQSTCTNGTDNCITCLNSENCSSCAATYRVLEGVCTNCNDINCITCVPGDINNCTGCMPYWGLNISSNDCTNCIDLSCKYCTADYSVCTVCLDGFGFDSLNSCQSCLASNCLDCQANRSLCVKCALSFGLDTSSGQCVNCALISSICAQCNQSNVNQCIYCNSGYGINYAADPNVCSGCDPTCATCSVWNYQACYTCSPRYYLSGYDCLDCLPNCQNCTNSSICQICVTSAYLTAIGDCPLCVDGCSVCQWDYVYGKIQCNICVNGTALITTVTPNRCPDLICGDSLTLSRPCDNALGVPYDGCDDNCQVMTDFNCTVDTNTESTLCSFNGTLVMQVTSFKRVRLQNRLIIKVSVSPPLQVFKLSTQAQNNALFSAAMDNTEVKNITFDTTTSELTIELEMTGQIITATPVTVFFTPSISIRPEYCDTQAQSLTLTIDYGNQKIYFISSSQTTIANTFLYLGYAIVALAWISCILGLFLRHLASLQAMLVVQFSWLMVLWLNVQLNLPLLKVWPLKYSHGFALSFDGNSTIDQSESAPFTSQFRLSASHFHSNFNLLLVLFIISLIAVIVTYIRMQNFVKEHKLKSIDDIYKKAADPEIKESGQKIEGRYELAEQSLMTATMLSIVPFASSAALFIKIGDITNASSLSLLAISGIVILTVLARFYWNPHPCGYFRYSFRGRPLAMLHCFVHVLALVIAISLLVALPSLSFAPIAPIALQLIYTIAYRPYQLATDNVRSVFNLIVMCAFVGFRIFAQYSPEETLNSNFGFAFLLGLYGALFLVIIIGLVFTTYYFYWYNYRLPQIRLEKRLRENNFRDVVIQEMGEFDPNRKMQDVDANLSFKPLIEPSATMRNFTFELQSTKSEHQHFVQDEMLRQQMRNYHSTRPQKLEASYQTNNHRNKNYMKALLRSDQLKLTDEIVPEGKSSFDFKENKLQQREVGTKNNDKKQRKIAFPSDEVRKEFTHVALTAIKEEKKFIECHAVVLTVEKYLRQPVEPNADQYDQAYSDIPVIKY